VECVKCKEHMVGTGVIAGDSLYRYYLSAATVGIWIVNSI